MHPFWSCSLAVIDRLNNLVIHCTKASRTFLSRSTLPLIFVHYLVVFVLISFLVTGCFMIYSVIRLIMLDYLNRPLIATSPIKASRTDSALIGPSIPGLVSARDSVLQVTVDDATLGPTTALGGFHGISFLWCFPAPPRPNVVACAGFRNNKIPFDLANSMYHDCRWW